MNFINNYEYFDEPVETSSPVLQIKLNDINFKGVLKNWLRFTVFLLKNPKATYALNKINDIEKLFGKINNWDTSRVTDMSNLFLYLDYIKFKDFNKIYNKMEISNWNTSNVITMESMFSNLKHLNIDISKWETKNVKKMNNMFYNCYNINVDISNWNFSNVITMESMFSNCYNIKSDLTKLDTSNVQIMKDMFKGCKLFNQNLRTNVVTRQSDKSEYKAWNTENVTNMSGMFNNCHKFNFGNSETTNPITFQNRLNWNTKNVIDMSYLFNGCYRLFISVDNLNTSNVKYMNSMFKNCNSFNLPLNTKLDTYTSKVFWDVSSVINMESMFESCLLFDQNLNNWNTINVTNMNSMFKFCNNFNSDISTFNTTNVKSMNTMFFKCFKFNIDISTKIVKKDVYKNMIQIEEIEYYAWNVYNVTEMKLMLHETTNFYQDLTSWNLNPSNEIRSLKNNLDKSFIDNCLPKKEYKNNIPIDFNINVYKFNKIKNEPVLYEDSLTGVLTTEMNEFINNLDEGGEEGNCKNNLKDSKDGFYKFGTDNNFQNLNKNFIDKYNKDHGTLSDAIKNGIRFDENNNIINKRSLFNYVAHHTDLCNNTDIKDKADPICNKPCLYELDTNLKKNINTYDKCFNGIDNNYYNYNFSDTLNHKKLSISSTNVYTSYYKNGDRVFKTFSEIPFKNYPASNKDKADFNKFFSTKLFQKLVTSDNYKKYSVFTSNLNESSDKDKINYKNNLLLFDANTIMYAFYYAITSGFDEMEQKFGPINTWRLNKKMTSFYSNTFSCSIFQISLSKIVSTFFNKFGKLGENKIKHDSFKTRKITIIDPINNNKIEWTAWDTKNITDFESLFAGKYKEYTVFKYVDLDISNWNTSNVTNMKNMFLNCLTFNIDISSKFIKLSDNFDDEYIAWDIQKVTNLESTFENCTNFNQNIGNWNTINVKSFKRMFFNAKDFSQNLSTKF